MENVMTKGLDKSQFCQLNHIFPNMDCDYAVGS